MAIADHWTEIKVSPWNLKRFELHFKFMCLKVVLVGAIITSVEYSICKARIMQFSFKGALVMGFTETYNPGVQICNRS